MMAAGASQEPLRPQSTAADVVVGEGGTPGRGGDTPARFVTLSVLALVLANAVPFFGVLLLRWDLGLILLLYWAESAVILLFNLLKLVRLGLGGIAAAAFFSFHAGLFMLVHLAFLFVLFHPLQGRTAQQAAADLGWPILGFVLSHGVSFVHNTLRRGEAPKQLGAVMAGFYGRIFVMQLTIILGAFLMAAFGSPLWALALLVVLKTAVDLGAHLRERRKHAPAPDADARGPAPS